MARRGSILLLVLATAMLTAVGYGLLFTTFMSHDDEGYVLISLKSYASHGGLYHQVYSQYGPFPYVLHDFAHRLLGYAFNNTMGRWLTLGCWMGAVVSCTVLVWRQTRHFGLSAFTLGLTFFHLWLMVGEPSHPGGLITLLIALAALGGAYSIDPGATRALALIVGAIGAALALTKINVGVFFLVAAGVWFVVHLAPSLARSRCLQVTATLLAVLAPALMGGTLHATWAQTYAALSTIASLTMLFAASQEPKVTSTWRDAAWVALAGTITAVVVIILVMARGTSLAELLEGILLGPLRHPGVYHYPPFWRRGALAVGLISVVLAIAWSRGRSALLIRMILGLRLALGFLIALGSIEAVTFTSHSSVMSYGLPLAWILVVRVAPGATRAPGGTAWIGLLLVLQYLHAFPVAGSQVAWGTFLFIPLLAFGLHDSLEYFRARGRDGLPAALGWMACALALASGVHLGRIAWDHYQESPALGLPGAENLRPPESLASTLRIVSENAVAHGDLLFSLPGMYSFNLWTDLPTPTLQNTTHWFSLLTPSQQQEIIASLKRSQRPVILVHRLLLDLLEESKFVVSGPLTDYLHENFERAFRLGTYEFWVRRGRTIAPLSSAEFYALDRPQAGLPAYKFEVIAALAPDTQIASIEVESLEPDRRRLLHFDTQNGALHAMPLTLEGKAAGPEIDQAWSHPLPRLVRLSLPLDELSVPTRKNSIVYLRDAQGSIVAEARFME